MNILKVINNERKNLNTSWNHWSHCRTNWVGDHSSVQRIKIMASSELTAAKFLIYWFIWVHLLYCRYIALKQEILLRKLGNHSQSLKPQQNHKFTYRISSNKCRASNKRLSLISVFPLISLAPLNAAVIRIVTVFYQ